MRVFWARILMLGSFVCIGASSIWGTNIVDLVGAENASVLEKGNSVKKVQLKDPIVSMMPKTDISESLATIIANFDPNLLVETLYVFKKPANSNKGQWSQEERTAIYNVMRALSTLSGIEYYSASRKSMRIFYEHSFIVDGPDGQEHLPDPIVSIPPERSTLYAIQKDLTFGENLYKYDYFTSEESLSFVQENLTNMNYGIVPILPKGRLRTIVLVSDAGDSLLIYSVAAVRAMLLPGIEGKVRDSFSNRADAIYSWFSKHAENAFLLVSKPKE